MTEPSFIGIATDVSVTDDTAPPIVSLLDMSFHDMRDGTDVKLSIVWDRARRRFDFAGDTELCTPAARQFFDEFGACAMDWLKEHLT